MSKLLKVVYPPLRDLSEIPFLLASSISTARSAGIEIELIDANQLYWNHIMDVDKIKIRYEKLVDEFQYWHEQVEVPPEKQEYVYGLFKAFLRRELVEEELDNSIMIMKNSNKIEEREEARTIIRYALELFQLPYYPTQLTINDANLVYSTESTEQMIKSINHESNPFGHFLTTILEETADDWIIWVEADQQLIPTFTLTHLIHKQNPVARVRWTGPFFSEFGTSLLRQPPLMVDQIVAVNHPKDFLVSLNLNPTDHRIVWGTDNLVLSEYWTPYIDIRLRSEWKDDVSLFSWLQTEIVENRRLYLYQPTIVKDIMSWSEHFAKVNLPWGVYLKFDQFLDSSEVKLLKNRGLDWIHWELKGWLVSELEEDIKSKLRGTFEALKDEDIPLYISVVMGYPLTSPETFKTFVEYLCEHQELIDRIVRFKLFRLYQNSIFWRQPEAFGIESIASPTPGKDMQRGFDFKTKTGWDSENFHQFATSLVARLQRNKDRDFPRDVLAVDDSKLVLSENYIRNTESELISFDDNDEIILSPYIKIMTLPFSPIDLEKSVQPTVPDREKLYYFDSIQRKESRVIYDRKKDRFMIINKGVEMVLKQCSNPIKWEALLRTYPAKQQSSIRQLLKKLLAGGIVIEKTSTKV